MNIIDKASIGVIIAVVMGQCLLCGLKLYHIINWSWWLITIPAMSLGGIIALVLFFLILTILAVKAKRAFFANRY